MKNDNPQVVQDCHACLLWVIPCLDKFPRNRRFTLGERIETQLLELLELLTAATYQKNNTNTLKKANQKLAIIRHLWRLAYELRVTAIKQYEHGSRLFLNVGQQIGGWVKYAR